MRSTTGAMPRWDALVRCNATSLRDHPHAHTLTPTHTMITYGAMGEREGSTGARMCKIIRMPAMPSPMSTHPFPHLHASEIRMLPGILLRRWASSVMKTADAGRGGEGPHSSWHSEMAGRSVQNDG